MQTLLTFRNSTKDIMIRGLSRKAAVIVFILESILVIRDAEFIIRHIVVSYIHFNNSTLCIPGSTQIDESGTVTIPLSSILCKFEYEYLRRIEPNPFQIELHQLTRLPMTRLILDTRGQYPN